MLDINENTYEDNYKNNTYGSKSYKSIHVVNARILLKPIEKKEPTNGIRLDSTRVDFKPSSSLTRKVSFECFIDSESNCGSDDSFKDKEFSFIR